ncbi:MAG: T9SS type A sorting domain-containing protein [Bacteroidia bacterium]|nr:T9SS type A sorting domain-containing protein [Bacteroidia bacterium]
MKKQLFNTILLAVGIANGVSAQQAYYPFSGNANDASGNNHHGVVTNATLTNDRNSNANSAYNFNGTSAYIEIADTSAFNMGQGSFSLSYWFKTSSTQSYMFAFSTGVQAFSSGISSVVNYNSNGDVILAVGATGSFNNTNSIIIGTASSFNDGNWHHYVGIVDKTNNRARIYIDNVLQTLVQINAFGQTGGVLVNSDKELDITGVDFSTKPSHLAYIGKSGNQFVNQSYNGDIDDIGFYTSAISASDVTTLYNGGALGVDEHYSTFEFNIFPNPAVDKIYFSEKELLNNFTAHVFSTDGKLLKTEQLNYGSIDVSDLSKGFYFIQITSPDNSRITKRFIKN